MNAHIKEIDHTKSNFTEHQIRQLLYYIDFKAFIMEIAGRNPTDN